MHPLRIHVVFNANSGTAAGLTPDALSEQFAAAGFEAAVDSDMARPLRDRVAEAAASQADIIVAAGGDGTVTAVAAALLGSNKKLAILPLGTANLLARDLAVPLDIKEAISTLREMQPRAIDVCEVNGRIFLHKVVIGFAPAVAAGREHLRHNPDFGTRLSFLRFFWRRLTHPQDLRMTLERDGADNTETLRVRSIAVANNAYDEELGRFFSRRRLDRGLLTVYALRHLGLIDLLRLTAGMALGRWRDDEALIIHEAHEVRLSTQRQLVQAMIDGEVEKIRPPLDFRIHPQALTVLAPVAQATEAPEDEAIAPAPYQERASA
ncbi:diacylglycerol/lipid kinase family protein [Rhodopseudomonas julia]|uniref:Diacylglycerol kinase family enzyme n=1 Tax=Rhodopseudomonas julia TaxID=200617 RepID=A0ABU0C3S3_9BRAD|nr:diacylglycerol kinase family protein [Rhodopseudomonas julia]MDQ0325120.1 diacylglycerol kinase family enzyme [Rhodopseudomonas julia]